MRGANNFIAKFLFQAELIVTSTPLKQKTCFHLQGKNFSELKDLDVRITKSVVGEKEKYKEERERDREGGKKQNLTIKFELLRNKQK